MLLYEKSISYKGSVMHEDLQIDDISKSGGILHRGELIYYLGSLIFGTGIALLFIGTAFVMIFSIHSKSDPGEIVLTTIFVALGIALILIGINMMMRQTKYGKYIMIAGSFLSLIAILIFVLNFYRNWYYPIISYIIILYVTGFSILLVNTFANITAWMIHEKTEIVTSGEDKAKIYTDEEIQRDIEEATRKSMELAASELQFEIGNLDNIKVGKAFYESRGMVTRVKDDMDESLTLKQTISPGETEEWGSIGLDKVSMQLAKALEEQATEKRKYKNIKERIKKGWEKITNFLRLK
jgi:hypothetical protein